MVFVVLNDSLASVAGNKGADRRLVQAGDLQVQVRQIAAALVDEQLGVQPVIQWAQLDQAQHPGDQTAGRRAARRERDAVLLAELTHVVRN